MREKQWIGWTYEWVASAAGWLWNENDVRLSNMIAVLQLVVYCGHC